MKTVGELDLENRVSRQLLSMQETINELIQSRLDHIERSLKRIADMRGCECDISQGHLCQMCAVRSIAREALDHF